MASGEIYVNKSGLEGDVAKMRSGLEQFMSAVKAINTGVDAAPSHWKGATETAYMEKYNNLRKTMEKDVPEAVEGMMKFITSFVQGMNESDTSAANSLR